MTESRQAFVFAGSQTGAEQSTQRVGYGSPSSIAEQSACCLDS